MNNFIITGYPRSRTAWLANYFDCGFINCEHEPEVIWGKGNDFYKDASIINKLFKEGLTGISDGSLLLSDTFLRYVACSWIDANIVVIKRDKAEVANSLTQFFGKHRINCKDLVNYGIPQISKAIDSLEKCGLGNVMIVDYNELDSKIMDIHKFLDIPFNKKRFDRLVMMNVQQDPVKKLEALQPYLNESINPIVQ